MLSIFKKKRPEVILKVEGMHCEGCSNTLKGVVRTIKGVKDNQVSLDKNEARISFDPEKVSLEEIINSIHVKTPYKVTGKEMV